MKVLKIVVGFILLLSTGAEYINASRQIGSLYSPGIIFGCIIMIVLSTWLIGSGFSVRKFKFKSFEFVKFFIISFVIFAIAAIFSLGSAVAPKNIVEINGLKIPLDKCIDGNKKIMPDPKESEEYCKCFIEKITNEPELKQKYKGQLENNKVLDVFTEVINSQHFKALGVENCMKSVKMKWTDDLANSMKRNWKEQLSGTEFEETNDIDKYCDCLIDEYQKYSLGVIMEENFLASSTASEIMEHCTNKSLKNAND